MSNDDASNRMVSGEGRPEDDGALDRALRPQTLDDLIGQDKVRDNLRTMVHAARARGEALDHVLIYGPPGLGKTTLSHIVGIEMGVDSARDRRAGDRARWRSGRHPHQSARQRHPVHRRNPSPEPRRRRSVVSGDGRLCARYRDRQGAKRAQHAPQAAGDHRRRRDHAPGAA